MLSKRMFTVLAVSGIGLLLTTTDVWAGPRRMWRQQSAYYGGYNQAAVTTASNGILVRWLLGQGIDFARDELNLRRDNGRLDPDATLRAKNPTRDNEELKALLDRTASFEPQRPMTPTEPSRKCDEPTARPDRPTSQPSTGLR